MMINDVLKLSRQSRNLIYKLMIPFLVILIGSTIGILANYNIASSLFGVQMHDLYWEVPALIVSLLLWYIPFVVLAKREDCFNLMQFIFTLLLCAMLIYFTYFAIP